MKNLTVIFVLLILISGVYANSEIAEGNKTNNNSDSITSACLNLDGLPPVGDQVVAGSCYAGQPIIIISHILSNNQMTK